MYQRITEITDHLFQDIEMTEEAMALKEELTADLSDRYADLLSTGISEDDAIAQIKADLADFGELTQRFPHRQRSLKPVAPDAISAAGVTEIRVSLGSDDLAVIPSEDEQIRLELTGDPTAHWHSELNNGCLSLEIVRPEETAKSSKQPESISEWLLQTLSSISVHISRDSCRGTIRVPVNWRGALDVMAGSGDVQIELPLHALTVRTGSGDVDARLEADCMKARISTASGDVKLSGSIGDATVTTASGDIDMSGCADCLRITTVSGDAEIAGVKANTLICKTTSGDLGFQGEAREIEYRTVSGDIQMTLSGNLVKVSGSAVSGDTTIILADHQPASVHGTTVSGDVQLSCQDGPGAAIINYKSVSGDIRIM